MTFLPPHRLLLPAFIAFAVGVVLTPLVGRAAVWLGVVAKPRADRWAGRPVPMLGGVSIFGACLAATLWCAPGISGPSLGLLLGGGFLLVFGALDDKFAFRPQTKLVAQVLGACIVTGFGIGFKLRPVELFNILVSILWLVAIINAVNLMDNMDGLAPGVSFVAAVFLAVQLMDSEMPNRTTIAAALAGALGGFLVYNFPPARIFMGDAGSHSVGIVLGGLSLSNSLFADEKLGTLSVLLGPALVLAVPLLDVVLVTVTRMLRGQPISQGGRDHSSHRLIHMGLSERKAVLVFCALAAVSGFVGSQLAKGASLGRSLVLVPLSWIPLGLFFAWLAKVKIVTEERPADGRAALIVGWVFKRRMFEVLMDLGLSFACFFAAYLIRFDFHFEPLYRDQIVASAPWVIGITLASLAGNGVYGGHWEHYGVRDVFRLAKATLLSSLACMAVAVVLYRFEHFPRSVFPAYGVLLFVALMGVRASFQFFDIYLAERSSGRALILGTGTQALTALAYLAGIDGKGCVAGFIDPHSSGAITQLKGLPVIALERLAGMNGSLPYDRIIIAEPSMSGAELMPVRALATRESKTLLLFEVAFREV